MPKTKDQSKNYDWMHQKIKNRTTIIRSSHRKKATLLDHIRSLLF